MKAKKILRQYACAVVGLALASPALAGDWYWGSALQGLTKHYSGSEQLDSLSGVGLSLTADYLERGGIAAGYNYNEKRYLSGLLNAPQSVREHVVFGDLHINVYPDPLPGPLTLRLDGYAGQDEIRSRITTTLPGPMGGSGTRIDSHYDDFWALHPVVSFLNYAKTLYLDLGYAFSHYANDDGVTDDLDVRQWTPTLGLGFNQAYDWVQLRAYVIDLSRSNRIGDKRSTRALEAKWFHWFGIDAPLGLHSVFLSLLGGERLYAVDGDAHALYNIADLQTGAAALGAEWTLGRDSQLLLVGGYDRAETLTSNDTYHGSYLFAQLSHHW